jgi:hypothetical protein
MVARCWTHWMKLGRCSTRRRYLRLLGLWLGLWMVVHRPGASISRAAAQPKAKVPVPVAEAEERQAKIPKVTEAAAQQFRDELAQKKAKAEERHLELIKEATILHLRQEFGKPARQKLAPHQDLCKRSLPRHAAAA